VTIGPVIDNGFYYDFAYERAFTPDDLAKIEPRCRRSWPRSCRSSRRVIARRRDRLFRDKGEHFKAEIIDIDPANEDLSLYSQGEFTDLCRGPHVPNTDKLAPSS
jgi:threonyl-tRNA synthetase